MEKFANCKIIFLVGVDRAKVRRILATNTTSFKKMFAAQARAGHEQVALYRLPELLVAVRPSDDRYAMPDEWHVLAARSGSVVGKRLIDSLSEWHGTLRFSEGTGLSLTAGPPR